MNAREYWNNIDPKHFRNVGSLRLNPPNNHNSINMAAQILFTPTDPIIVQDIEDNNLRVPDPRFINISAVKIYKYVQRSMLYKNDDINTGWRDYRMFPYELRSYKYGDCDDHAVNIVSYLIAAGIPEWRVKVVEGETRQGYHATVYVLKDNLKEWVHLNSTGTGRALSSLDDASIFKKGKICTNGTWSGPVGLDITVPTCSYNNVHAWQGFTGQTDEDLNMKITRYCDYFVPLKPHKDGNWWGAISITNHSELEQVCQLSIKDYTTGSLIRKTLITLQPSNGVLINNRHDALKNITGRTRVYLECDAKVTAKVGNSRGTDNAIVWEKMEELLFPS